MEIEFKRVNIVSLLWQQNSSNILKHVYTLQNRIMMFVFKLSTVMMLSIDTSRLIDLSVNNHSLLRNGILRALLMNAFT